MAPLTDQIDRFVRWFFNSSPDQISIEPRPRDGESLPEDTRVPARQRRANPPAPGRKTTAAREERARA